MILKHISTEAKRTTDYDCEIWMGKRYTENMVGRNIELKVFGLVWIVVKKYSFRYEKR
jgi:hypothetical protein